MSIQNNYLRNTKKQIYESIINKQNMTKKFLEPEINLSIQPQTYLKAKDPVNRKVE